MRAFFIIMVEFEVEQQHRPSSRSIFLVFFVVALLSAVIFAWGFFINVGDVVVSGEYPFRVSVGNIRDHLCISSESCVFSFAPGEYTVLAEMSSHYPVRQDVVVVRGDTVFAEVRFDPIPFLSAYEGVLESTEKSALEDWGDVEAFDWMGDRAVYLTDDQYGGLDLSLWDGGISDKVVSFESLTGSSLALGRADVAIVDDGRLFLVDLERKRRKRLFDSNVEVLGVRVDHLGDLMLVESIVHEAPRLSYWIFEQQEFVEFEWYRDSDLIVWNIGRPSTLLVVADLDIRKETLGDRGKFRLFSVDLGGDEISVSVVHDFGAAGITPVRMWYQGNTLLLEDESGSIWEMVL